MMCAMPKWGKRICAHNDGLVRLRFSPNVHHEKIFSPKLFYVYMVWLLRTKVGANRQKCRTSVQRMEYGHIAMHTQCVGLLLCRSVGLGDWTWEIVIIIIWRRLPRDLNLKTQDTCAMRDVVWLRQLDLWENIHLVHRWWHVLDFSDLTIGNWVVKRAPALLHAPCIEFPVSSCPKCECAQQKKPKTPRCGEENAGPGPEWPKRKLQIIP